MSNPNQPAAAHVVPVGHLNLSAQDLLVMVLTALKAKGMEDVFIRAECDDSIVLLRISVAEVQDKPDLH